MAFIRLIILYIVYISNTSESLVTQLSCSLRIGVINGNTTYKQLNVPPRGAKPPIPQNIRGTLTLSNNSAYTLIFTIIPYKSCVVVTFIRLEPLLIKNYIYIIAFAPNMQRALNLLMLSSELGLQLLGIQLYKDLVRGPISALQPYDLT